MSNGDLVRRVDEFEDLTIQAATATGDAVHRVDDALTAHENEPHYRGLMSLIPRTWYGKAIAGVLGLVAIAGAAGGISYGIDKIFGDDDVSVTASAGDQNVDVAMPEAPFLYADRGMKILEVHKRPLRNPKNRTKLPALRPDGTRAWGDSSDPMNNFEAWNGHYVEVICYIDGGDHQFTADPEEHDIGVVLNVQDLVHEAGTEEHEKALDEMIRLLDIAKNMGVPVMVDTLPEGAQSNPNNIGPKVNVKKTDVPMTPQNIVNKGKKGEPMTLQYPDVETDYEGFQMLTADIDAVDFRADIAKHKYQHIIDELNANVGELELNLEDINKRYDLLDKVAVDLEKQRDEETAAHGETSEKFRRYVKEASEILTDLTGNPSPTDPEELLRLYRKELSEAKGDMEEARKIKGNLKKLLDEQAAIYDGRLKDQKERYEGQIESQKNDYEGRIKENKEGFEERLKDQDEHLREMLKEQKEYSAERVKELKERLKESKEINRKLELKYSPKSFDSDADMVIDLYKQIENNPDSDVAKENALRRRYNAKMSELYQKLEAYVNMVDSFGGAEALKVLKELKNAGIPNNPLRMVK